jgi:hypothetical protein
MAVWRRRAHRAARENESTMTLKIFIGSPCYDSMEPEFVGSLIATMDALHDRGHELCDWGYIRGTLPHFARNALAAEAMSEGADVMVQIDADHQWKSGHLVEAIECVGAGVADVVGFAHVTRSNDTLGGDPFVSPKLFKEKSLRAIRHEGVVYVEVRAVGTGILVASRRCLEQLSSSAPKNKRGQPKLFMMPDETGEDVYFCDQWRQLGGKVYCHRDAVVAHIGKTTFAASFQLAVRDMPIEVVET